MTYVEAPILRIDSIGRAKPLREDALTYMPYSPELRQFLMQFITMHNGRMRAVVRGHYGRSLHSLNTPLPDAAIDTGRRPNTIETTLHRGTRPARANSVRVCPSVTVARPIQPLLSAAPEP